MVNMLQLKNVTVSYKNVPTVQNFNLDMKQGQIVSLVGESGSGKTTVIGAVLGLLAGGGVVSGGSITFEGKDLLSYNREEWRNLRGSEISMIFQDSGAMMNPTRKVGDVFVEYLRTHEKISKKDAWAKGCGMLEKMNLPSPDNVMKSYPFQLSGGMRQRVIIALATFMSPNVVLADEPTTALDVVVQKGILKMLMRLQKQLKNTMVIVSHDMGVHYQITDRMAIMYSGSIIELGPTDAIFNDPIHPYTKMLVDSLPRVGDKSQKVGIPGRPPALKNPPPGCRFAARCPHATDRCRQEIPEFIEVKPGRFAACHLLKKEGEKNG